jgi:hypothetical protein
MAAASNWDDAVDIRITVVPSPMTGLPLWRLHGM